MRPLRLQPRPSPSGKLRTLHPTARPGGRMAPPGQRLRTRRLCHMPRFFIDGVTMDFCATGCAYQPGGAPSTPGSPAGRHVRPSHLQPRGSHRRGAEHCCISHIWHGTGERPPRLLRPRRRRHLPASPASPRCHGHTRPANYWCGIPANAAATSATEAPATIVPALPAPAATAATTAASTPRRQPRLTAPESGGG